MDFPQAQAAVEQLVHELEELNIQLTPFIHVPSEIEYDAINLKNVWVLLKGWPPQAPIMEDPEKPDIAIEVNFDSEIEEQKNTIEIVFPDYRQEFKALSLSTNLAELLLLNTGQIKKDALNHLGNYLIKYQQQFSVSLKYTVLEESNNLVQHFRRYRYEFTRGETIRYWSPQLCARNIRGQTVSLGSIDDYSIEHRLPPDCVARIIATAQAAK